MYTREQLEQIMNQSIDLAEVRFARAGVYLELAACHPKGSVKREMLMTRVKIENIRGHEDLALAGEICEMVKRRMGG